MKMHGGFAGEVHHLIENKACVRRMGPFEPERLPLPEMEYTTMPEVAAKLASRWHSLEERAPTVAVVAPAANVE